ncbi:hypothetical protein SAMN05421810_101114 [Amycolatopsis arida]|uniref:Uncharacterized protein n=1 Tax=Amycolatopsis arida TaxID=587909 RepID=A0A1I5KEN3_9PSEU|nr:hypothetical protein [Amycolatopsis arida]TDX97010.1 hypothetical protein CLV69_102112 [Amycolatopsis arida]SFO83458.1 hypothetical protein SAMN05421810_101114 [Amycolatopsis arida]
MTDEYTVTRVDLDGCQVIMIRLREQGPHEVLADHSIPSWKIDAYVRAALVRKIAERQKADSDGPAASA